MLSVKLTVAAIAVCALSAVSAQVTETPVTLPAGSTPAGTDFTVGLVGNDAIANPDAAFYSTQIFFTNHSTTNLLYTNESTPIPIASGTFSPGFKNGAWNETTLDFTPLNETRYCTMRPGNSQASFSYDTSTWSPGSYDLHVRTIVFKGEANGVEVNSTDPNRVELCISAPFTNSTTETIARFDISAAGSGQPNSSLGSTLVTLRMATQPASATAGAPTATPAGTGGAAQRVLVASGAAVLAGAVWSMGVAFQY